MRRQRERCLSNRPLRSETEPAVPNSSTSKTRIAQLEIDEIEQCFRRVRPAAMQLGRENDIDSFASRASALRQRLRAAGTTDSELDSMLAALRDDVQQFLKALQSPH